MNTLWKLYSKNFLITLSIVTGSLSIIISLINLIEKLHDFLKFNPPLEMLLRYVLLNIPQNIFYMLPMAALICGIFIFTTAVKHNEIIIIKASGGRIRRLLTPFILIGICLSVLSFLLSEFIMPDAAEHAENIKAALTERADSTASKSSIIEGTLWMRDKKGAIVKLNLYSHKEQSSSGIEIFLFNNNALDSMITAKTARWNGETWELSEVIKFNFKTGKTENIKSIRYDELESPAYFSERLKKPEEMNMRELSKFVRIMKQSGYRNPKLITDLSSRIAYPMINFFMLILGISLPLRSNFTNSLVASGIGLTISLIYWGGFLLFISLGRAGIIPPVIAPWLMPSVFAFVSFRIFMKLPE
jgi:lipopolysaccharide export system permease protein